MSEIQQAREVLKIKPVGKDVPKDVDPLYITVIEADVAFHKDMGQRTVFIDYDEFGNIVGVELL